MDKSKNYMNPYLAGMLIGVMMIAAYYFSGEGLGSSGSMKSVVISATNVVAHNYATKHAFFTDAVSGEDAHPLKTWLIFEMLGVIIGAIVSAAFMDRLTFKIIKAPHITNKTRLIAALTGGIFFGVGSQLGRGCTSGLVMSGMSVLSLSGFIGLIGIFGGGYMIAYFFRKLWI